MELPIGAATFLPRCRLLLHLYPEMARSAQVLKYWRNLLWILNRMLLSAGSAPSPSYLYTRCVSTRVQTDLKGLHWRERQAATIQKVEKDEKQVDRLARQAAAAQGCVPWLCPLNSSCSPITHLIQLHLIPEPGQMVLLSAQSPPLKGKEGRRGWPEGT